MKKVQIEKAPDGGYIVLLPSDHPGMMSSPRLAASSLEEVLDYLREKMNPTLSKGTMF